MKFDLLLFFAPPVGNLGASSAAPALLSLNPLAALFVHHTVTALIDLLLAAAPSSGQPSMPPTAEQPGLGCTWLKQKVPCELHAL